MSVESPKNQEISVEENPRVYAQKYNGRKCPEMDIQTEVEGVSLVPQGWVVDGSSNADFWNNISQEAIAIPLKPQERNLMGFIRRRELKTYRKKYGLDVVMVMIPDEESLEYWSGGPVKLKDLIDYKGKPGELLHRSLDLMQNRDLLGSDMKRRAYMLLTGAVDTK